MGLLEFGMKHRENKLAVMRGLARAALFAAKLCADAEERRLNREKMNEMPEISNEELIEKFLRKFLEEEEEERLEREQRMKDSREWKTF